jgi:FtsH-binding integral membrane protein
VAKFLAVWALLTIGATVWAVLYARRLDSSNREASGAVRWAAFATLPGTCFLVELALRYLLVQVHELQSVTFEHFFTLIPSALGLAVGPVLFAVSFFGFSPSRSRPWVELCRGLQMLVWGLAVFSVANSVLSV